MKRRYFISCAGVLISLLAVILIYINYDSSYSKISVDLYFMNDDLSGIVSEAREIRYRDDIELAANILENLRKGPSASNKRRIIDRGTVVNNLEMSDDKSIKVDFTNNFLSDDPIKNVLRVYAVTKSLCSTGKISQVFVTAENLPIADRDGNELGFVAASDINLETEEYSSEMRQVSLYFSNPQNMLVKEERTIKITDQQPIEQYIINELIKGPADKSLKAVLSKDTVLISAEVEDNICYLNFKSNFIKENAGNGEHEREVIYSIVNSLTELQTISRVQFYMDGKRVDKFGDTDIKEYISRDASIIQQ